MRKRTGTNWKTRKITMATINEQIRNVVKLLAKPANENEVTNLEKGIIVFSSNKLWQANTEITPMSLNKING